MKRLLVLLLACGTLVVVPAGASSASCAMEPPMHRAVAKARLLFVGTVVDVTNDDRWATVAVEEVWEGRDIPSQVLIKAGPRSMWPFMAMSSTDRTFRDGGRYLFFPYGREGSVMQDNSCTSTTVYRPKLDRFRPVHASEPVPIPVGGEPGSTSAAGALVSLTVAVFGAVSLYRRKQMRQVPSAA